MYVMQNITYLMYDIVPLIMVHIQNYAGSWTRNSCCRKCSSSWRV